MELPPLFAYMGSKQRMVKKLKPYFNTDFNTYVEPFCGGASVFFGIDMEGKKAVISDLNDDIIEAYKGVRDMKDYDYAALPEYAKHMTIEEMTEFIENAPCYGFEKYVATSMKQYYTFQCQGKGKLYNRLLTKCKTHFKRMNAETLSKYQAKLKNAKIINSEYRYVIDKYDAEDTLFYLDPPYERKNTKFYKYDDMDYEELATILKNIKGKFILSLNNSPRIQELFKDFNIDIIKTKNNNMHRFSKGHIPREEVIITNYKLI
jgi:DNA adenine methylase